MPTFDTVLNNHVWGDSFRVERTITLVPSGSQLTKAWFTVREGHIGAAVDDTDALFQLEITVDSTDAGQITDTGAGDASAALRFDITAAQSRLCPMTRPCHFSIKVLTNSGHTYTPETGVIFGKMAISRRSS